MKNNRIIFYVLLIFNFIACKQGVSDVEYREVVIPENLIFTRYLTDTVSFDHSNAKMKIITFADSGGCMGCKLQLEKWKELIQTVNSINGDYIPFLFFFDPLDIEEMSYLLFSSTFDYPIVIDSDKRIQELNGFTSDITLLLDQNNRVILSGNPIHDSDIKTLYLQKIKSIPTPSDIKKTKVKIEQNQISLINMKKGERTSIMLSLKNIGDVPLIIYGVDTSCGCVKAEFEKKPICPDAETNITLNITPTDLGFFNKTIRIKGNITENIAVNIQGDVTASNTKQNISHMGE